MMPSSAVSLLIINILLWAKYIFRGSSTALIEIASWTVLPLDEKTRTPAWEDAPTDPPPDADELVDATLT
ncbi:hypothetical protein D3C75_1050500 [compost metagenome]